MTFEPGTRVRVKQDIDKYPCGVVPEGTTGTVILSDGVNVHVKLDAPVEGYEPWGYVVYLDADAEVHQEEFVAGDYLEVL